MNDSYFVLQAIYFTNSPTDSNHRTDVGNSSVCNALCGKGIIEDFHHQPACPLKAVAELMWALVKYAACFVEKVLINDFHHQPGSGKN